MKLPFTKMHGAGNDYVYVNGFELDLPDPASVARFVSDRHKGIGSDGLILVRPSDAADCRMEMYNADGSRGAMCGNGIRCVGKLAWDRGLARRNPMSVETDSGVKTLDLHVEEGTVISVTVDMGTPVLDPAKIPARFEGERVVDRPLVVDGVDYQVTCISMGNPHCVVFAGDVEELDLTHVGPGFEHHSVFPEGVNTEFISVRAAGELDMRVWERGSGETWACGTGACAAVVAGSLTGASGRKAAVHLRGGDLEIDWRESDDRVFMRGDAVEVYRGEIEIPG